MSFAAPSTPSSSSRRSPSPWQLAWRQTVLDFRAGELRLVLVAVMLAVAALTAVGFFADRLQLGLQRDAAQLLGGDLVISSDQPLPEGFVQRAQSAGLRMTQHASFPSMARAGDEQGGGTRLVALKAVDEAYPLRGALKVQAQGQTQPASLRRGPAVGQVWVEEAVLSGLGLKVGDGLWLGDARLSIAGVLTQEPDRGAGFMSFAPRVMMHRQDLATTGLVQPASRVTYRLAVVAAGSASSLERFEQWVKAEVKNKNLKGVRVENLENGRPEMRQTLERAEKFLNLVALLSALLAAVAVAVAARDFAMKRLDDCAMLRVLGLSQRSMAWAFVLEFALLALVASGLGVLAGAAVHFAFIGLLGALVPTDLPWPSGRAAYLGLGVGVALLMGFGLPTVLQLAKVPALRVMRRDVGQIRPASLAAVSAGVVALGALLMTVARDPKMGALTVGGFAVALGVFALVAWGAVLLLRKLVSEATAPRWLLLATRQVAARPGLAVLQVASLAVGLMALALLVLLRTDLVDSWRKATPPDAPNRFVINIQPDQAEAFQGLLKGAGVTGHDWYPMIRGRLVAVNGEPTGPKYAANPEARRTIDRELNLSHAAQMPTHNVLVKGQWAAPDASGLSIEEGLAQRLGVGLGDVLSFDVGGQTQEGRINSIRKVDWGSMRANFFVMFPRAEMPDVPTTYMTAFKAPATPGFDSQVGRQFPNVTVVDVSASVAQVQNVLNQVIRAVEVLFAFTVATGLMVLLATISATRDARIREAAIMRACGASSHLLGQVQRAELMGLGALAGGLASAAAMGVGAGLARWVFEFTWTASPWVPLVGMVAGAVLAGLAGWWSLREVLRRPVMQTLRQASTA
ncbi:ABC transporter permease [Ideonella paludis]|uniref:ABC transporter permease n=1 Tax=Ideonella paludis TaxID=1233411 RepID=A0ABS5E1F0_9BURK|nr:FtsX-like permease family protein [Ideonella paludis]MBQ0937231.1 ABC transporter permease [Ideonella paludis]